MLRTNSKKALENIRAYILENFNGENYDFSGDPDDFHEVAVFIYNCFIEEKYKGSENYYFRCGMRLQDVFEDWAAGLPSVLDTCYYYNRSAVDDLAAILEESEQEKAKYNDESKAEKLLTGLIFLQLSKEARK